MKDNWSQVEEQSWESVMEAANPAKGQQLSPTELARLKADSARLAKEKKARKKSQTAATAKVEAAKIENLPLVEAAELRGLQYEKEGRRPGLMESMLPRVAEAQRRGGYGLLDMARAAGSDILSFPGAAFTSLPTSPLGALRMAIKAIDDFNYGDDRSTIRQVAESAGRSFRNTPAYMMQRDNIIADPANVIGFGVGKALSAAAKIPEAASTLGKIMRAEGLLATAGRGAIRGGLTGGASGFMRSDATGTGAALDAIPEAGAGVLGDALMSALGYGFRAHAAKKVADAYDMAPGINKAIRQERASGAGLRERFPVTREMLADLQTRVARGSGAGNYADWDEAAQRAKDEIRNTTYAKAERAAREEIDRGMYSLDPYFGEGGLAERAARDIVGIPAIADKYRTPAIEAAILDGAENPAGAVERQVLRNIVAKEVKPYLSGLSEPELSNFAIGRIGFGRKGNYSHLGTSESPLDQALAEALSADIVSPSALRRASEMQPEHYKILASQIRGTAKRQGIDARAMNEEIGDRIRKTLSSHLEERSPAWAATITPQVREDLAKASALREFVANTQSQGEATRRNIGGPVGMLMDLKAYRQDRSGGDNFQRAVEALRKAWKHQERTAPMLEAVLPYLGRSAGAYAVDEVQR